ncbi:DUF4157 domain-containing protein [[Leptolyngbya] sp. PCC 7376]|uniref:eCIS core domain-containing protein n=1 Tax=[Leptolyngbya] sp. PCC 7376 TaxID=111781 RepID=UPI000302E493|nr:DUF4157 domain-containing protein [[Leptolyngbya] sp. PCC 7376]
MASRQRQTKTSVQKPSPAIAPNPVSKIPEWTDKPQQKNEPSNPNFSGLSHELSFPVQAKLTIGEPNDRYKQGTDRVEGQVVQQIHAPVINQSADDSIQRKEDPEKGRSPNITLPKLASLQRKPTTKGNAVASGLESSINHKKRNNTGLPDNLKTGMENLSGISLDDVKVHRNSDKPAQLQAKAYAQGTDIHLGPGQEKHLPHEAWHIVQQKQGRVKPSFQMKGAAINDDSSLEREADVMGARALCSSLQTTQLKKQDALAPVLQRKKNSFPDDAEEQLKEMGVLQKKAKSSPIQFRGGPTVGVLRIRSTHVASSLLAGHAWLSYQPTVGGETTHGTWGNQDPIGYHRDIELGFTGGYQAERGTNVDNTDVNNLHTFIAANQSWGMINNCSSFAARGWKAVTKERLAYKSWGIPNPSALGVGIVAANGGTTGGVLPEDRSSSVNSVSSTSSSSIGISSNTANSALGSGSVSGTISSTSSSLGRRAKKSSKKSSL